MLISQAEWARQKGFSHQYVSKGTIRLVDGKEDDGQAEVTMREQARVCFIPRGGGLTTVKGGPRRESRALGDRVVSR